MKSFLNIILIEKILVFYIAVSIIVILAVKFWGDFPTYPPSIKKPISWEEVFERFQSILLTSFIISMFYIYGLYLDFLKNKNKK